ncbi:alpha-hydroxy-acid oxidizing protein [Clostridium perfringens]|uniref:alpha-hydroxy-acid oxidizing protein n=1 Tax=Clostridium perfringens TaxID=1502 RepID=UPI001A3384C4|nr:alpha-hydroxy-acid oxidizing protein [Clostridium perfringens]MBO3312223.1 alpha-hydroxy-acid oxidizing protein [Clostridium perfringens]MDU6633763.1 alpha-hydroxy-acid oxidizing protein [Clostridium perfringens]HAT4254022.1 alpha-hydroxy-acid oxidizing protein [Clostridium perfringens]
MNKDMRDKARELYNGSCRVCKVCNGVACAGEVPGMGGKGTGDSFIRNVAALEEIKLNMRTIHDAKNPTTNIEIFGKNMELPLFAAPITGTMLNMGGKVSEREYIEGVVKGCLDSGIYPMVGDTAVDLCLATNLEVIEEYNGQGIIFIKPWKNEVVIEKIKMAEKAGAFAVGVDIDAAGLITLAMNGKPVEPKNLEEIKELVNSTKLPFILKGIMTPDEAELAVEAGVDAIVISNHGGRVLDQTPASCEVLPEIAARVKGKVKILVDGGVRTGVDILKMIALGADCVLIGRPFITATFADGAKGVEEYVNSLKGELKSAMVLTGCNSIENIDNRVIYKGEN